MSPYLHFLSVALMAYLINADPIHLHTKQEFVIGDYNGPLNKHMFLLMKKAESIEIRNSNITAMEGHMVSLLPNLKKLLFVNCDIELDGVDIEHMLLGATNLKEFYAIKIRAKELRPEIVRTLPIEIYVMTDNNYPKLPGNLYNETHLKKLVLSRNHLQTVEEDAFNGLDKLEILDLETNKLKNIPKSVLTPLKSLKTLKLRENKFRSFGADDLPELPNLESIDVGYNPIKEIKLEGIEKVAPKLKSIDITGTFLTDEQIKALTDKYTNIDIKTE